MFEILRKLLMAGVVASTVHAATSDQWRSRAIYQVLTDRFARTDVSTTATCNTADRTYCGGSWQGIINQLDYIQNMGFTAIWISPVTYNLPENTPYGYAYHGYWQQDLYKLNSHFGTADDLKALSKALHDRGMYLMVDVVANHNGWDGSSSTVNYARFNPFNDQKYYHTYCPINNYSNSTEVEDCWMGDSNVELPDLRTEDQAVQTSYNTWIKQLISNYSIDGLRIDTVKYVNKPFWSSFQQAAGVFSTGEVFASDMPYVCDYQNYLDSTLNYPAYWPFMSFLNSTGGNTASLLSALNTFKTACKDVSLLGTFSENHDLPRFASQTQDTSLAKNVIALTLLWDGIPIIYAGQEQHYAGYADPANREATWLAKYSRQSPLYELVAAVNQVRNVAVGLDSGYLTYNIWAIYSDTNTVALRKGYDGHQIISVITNQGNSSASWTLNLSNTGWSAGTTVYEILTCTQQTIDSSGTLAVPMASGLPRVYFATSAASGSGICGAGSATASGGAQPSNTKKSVGVADAKARKRRKRTVAVAGVVAAAAGAV